MYYLSFREQLLLERIGKAVGRSDPLHTATGWIEAAQRAVAIAASALMSRAITRVILPGGRPGGCAPQGRRGRRHPACG
jgi:hypothetical protein